MQLKDGTFSYADGKLTYDNDKLRIQGNVQIDGDVAIGNTTGNNIVSTIEMVDGNFSSVVKKDEIISSINQSEEDIKLNANRIDLNGYVTMSNLSTSGQTTINGDNISGGTLTLGGSGNGYGRLEIRDGYNSRIGYWNKDGIYANGIEAENGTFSGKLSNGAYNNFYSDGSFNIGNGALTYNPRNGSYVNLGSNMSLLLNNVPLAGQNITKDISIGCYIKDIYNPGGDSNDKLFDSRAKRFYPNVPEWKSDNGGYFVCSTSSCVVKTPFAVFVSWSFYIDGSSRSIPVDSMMFCGLPEAEDSYIPVEFIRMNSKGVPDGTKRYGYFTLMVYQNCYAVHLTQSLAGASINSSGAPSIEWSCRFIYSPRL